MDEETLTAKIDFSDFAFMHSAPRFGYSYNIAQLASPDISRRWNYINGLIAFSVFLMAFYFIWALSEIVFKWLGVRRVGFLAGRVTHQQNDSLLSQNYIRKRHTKIQLLFLASCIAVFVGGGLLLKNGLPRIDIAVRETLVLNQDVRMALDKGLGVANSVDTARSNVIDSKVHEMLLSDNYCNNTDEKVASLLLANTSNYTIECNYTNASNCTQKSVTIFSSFQEKLREEGVDGVRTGILHMIDNLQHFDGFLAFYSNYHWIARMFVLCLFNLCAFLMVSVIVTMLRKENFAPLSFMNLYFILPLFFVLVLIVWMVMILFAASAIMNSDFCVGNGEGPESTIQNALLENGYNIDDLTYQSFMYFKSECTISKPWDPYTLEYRGYLEEGVDVASFLLSRMDETEYPELTKLCGRDFTPIFNEAEKMKGDLMRLSSNLDDALELSRCERVAPIYRTFFNGPTCTESLSGLSWVFYSLFVLCVGGIIMFTLRSALYHMKLVHVGELDSLDVDVEQKEESKDVVTGVSNFSTLDSDSTQASFTGKRERNNDDFQVNVEDCQDNSNEQTKESKKIRNNKNVDICGCKNDVSVVNENVDEPSKLENGENDEKDSQKSSSNYGTCNMCC